MQPIVEQSMRISDWLTIVSVLLSPLIAIQVQKWIERFNEKREKRIRIFQTLMSTRMAKLSGYHVEALNMIDFVFEKKNKKEKPVIDAWRSYHDHLGSLGESPTDAQLATWTARRDVLFVDLLYEMSKVVGYDFDKVELKRSAYSPKAHSDQEIDNQIIRESLVEILSGDKAIPVKAVADKDVLERQNALQASMQEYYDGKRTLNVRVDKKE